jgi:predicted transcriptional regulator
MVKIFSIKSEYSKKIFNEEKLVELRRQNVIVRVNEKCLIYTTSPVKKITGYFIVKEKVRLPVQKLWMKTKDIAGITKSQFMRYFEGCIEGTAIFFSYVKKFINGLDLDEMKSMIKNFRPPQSYYNLNETICNSILAKIDERAVCLSDF